MYDQSEIPTSWGKMALKNVKFDISAGLSVALVQIPMGLGIAIASGTTPLSGLVSAIVGGLIGTLIAGTQVGIKGPASGLIIVSLSIMGFYYTGDIRETFQFALAIYFVSGICLVTFGLFKFGKIADFFPSSVVKGMLAAIGLIILTKQLESSFLGEKAPFSDPFDILLNLDYYLLNINPVVAIITVNCLVFLIFLPRVKNKIISLLPPPMWVMLVSVSFVFLFDFFDTREVQLIGKAHLISSKLLLQIPDNLLDDIIFPDFSRINEWPFWMFVITVTLVSLIENLASAKAIENLDPYRRKSLINKDLIGSGVATIVSSIIGGLPAITVISRTSVNVQHHAKTTWANLWHGIFVFAFIFLFGKYMEFVPLAALSSILIYTGYKLASPKVFKDAYLRGNEQFFILLGTAILILAFGLVWGLALGMVLTLLIHSLKSGMSAKLFIKYLFKPGIKIMEDSDGIILKIKGIANFFNILKIKKLVEKLPKGKHVLLEFSNARLIDHTVLEYVYKHSKEYNRLGGNMELVGLDIHETSSLHPYSIHVHTVLRKKRLTKRQVHLQAFAIENSWSFQQNINWQTTHIEQFLFFASRPVEFEKNIIKGHYTDMGVDWQISDVTYDEGALLGTEVFHTTVQIINLPFVIPNFSIEKEQFADKVLEIAGFNDIDFETNDIFSKTFLLEGDDKEAITEFFNTELRSFFVDRDVYHLESNGQSIMLFKYFRLASFENTKRMIDFGHELTDIMFRSIHKLQ